MGKITNDICKLPEMKGQPVAAKEEILGIGEVDANGDGRKDERFIVKEQKKTFCGDVSDANFIGEITKTFGNYNNMVGNNLGTKLVGPYWTATLIKNHGTFIVVTKTALPVISTIKNGFKVKHLNKMLKIGDPVSVGDGKTYFVTDINLSGAISYNDKKGMQINYDEIVIILISENGINRLKSTRKIGDSDRKAVHFKDIQAVMNRSAFSYMYNKPEK